MRTDYWNSVRFGSRTMDIHVFCQDAGTERGRRRVKVETFGTVLSERALEIIMGHAYDDKSISSVRSFVYDMLGPHRIGEICSIVMNIRSERRKTRPSLRKQKAFQKTT